MLVVRLDALPTYIASCCVLAVQGAGVSAYFSRGGGKTNGAYW